MDEISTTTGLHAKILDVRNCFNCHPDHRGKDFSPALAGAEKFDHSKTRFVLIRHQIDYSATPLTCEKCHPAIQRSVFAFDDTACTNCHAEKDKKFMTDHVQSYGTNCLTCHEGSDHFAQFSHETSKFPLTGTHATIACEKCHLDANHQAHFTDLSTNCTGCHTEPLIHQGNFVGQTCDTCHTTTTWAPAQIDGKPFDHFSQTGFSLAKHTQGYDKSNLTCLNCHGTDIHSDTAGRCVDCHQKADPDFMTKHIAQFGAECSKCHDGVDRYKNFNHNLFFVLDGAHVGLDCTKCHGADVATAVYRGLGQSCITCHQEPDIHKGFFGLACQNCHTTTAWRPAMLKFHDFPLNHGGAEQACATCHPNTYTNYTCYSCHEHQQTKIEASHDAQNISREKLVNCYECHPTGLHQDWLNP